MDVPRCPKCGGVLYEDPDLAAWQRRMQRCEPAYREAMAWQERVGAPCSKNQAGLFAKYEAANP